MSNGGFVADATVAKAVRDPVGTQVLQLLSELTELKSQAARARALVAGSWPESERSDVPDPNDVFSHLSRSFEEVRIAQQHIQAVLECLG